MLPQTLPEADLVMPASAATKHSGEGGGLESSFCRWMASSARSHRWRAAKLLGPGLVMLGVGQKFEPFSVEYFIPNAPLVRILTRSAIQYTIQVFG